MSTNFEITPGSLDELSARVQELFNAFDKRLMTLEKQLEKIDFARLEQLLHSLELLQKAASLNSNLSAPPPPPQVQLQLSAPSSPLPSSPNSSTTNTTISPAGTKQEAPKIATTTATTPTPASTMIKSPNAIACQPSPSVNCTSTSSSHLISTTNPSRRQYATVHSFVVPSDASRNPAFRSVSLIIDNMCEEWGEGIDFPPFTVIVSCDEATHASVRGLLVMFRLLDGFGNFQDHLVLDRASSQERAVSDPPKPIIVSALRICRVSSKHGGTFKLQCLLVKPIRPSTIASSTSASGTALSMMGSHYRGGSGSVEFEVVASTLSAPVRVLCRRNFDRFSRHMPLQAQDEVSRMTGIGDHYARRFARNDIRCISDLARVVVPSTKFEELFASVRQTRGRLTRDRLVSLIAIAGQICNQNAVVMGDKVFSPSFAQSRARQVHNSTFPDDRNKDARNHADADADDDGDEPNGNARSDGEGESDNDVSSHSSSTMSPIPTAAAPPLLLATPQAQPTIIAATSSSVKPRQLLTHQQLQQMQQQHQLELLANQMHFHRQQQLIQNHSLDRLTTLTQAASMRSGMFDPPPATGLPPIGLLDHSMYGRPGVSPAMFQAMHQQYGSATGFQFVGGAGLGGEAQYIPLYGSGAGASTGLSATSPSMRMDSTVRTLPIIRGAGKRPHPDSDTSDDK